MESSIEQFDRQRIKLLKWLLVVYGLWHGMIILYALVGGTIAISFSRLEPLRAFVAQITKYYLAAGLIAFLVFLIFLLKWWLYKRALRKHPAIAAAVNDELVKQSWLRAFRQSFMVMIALLVAFEVLKIVTNTSLFWSWRSPWARLINVINFWHLQIILYVGIVTCLASFLRYNREYAE